MIFSKIKKGLKEAFIVSGYSRTAKELSFLSDRQLADLGVSRALLKQGASAFPWREELESLNIPDNVTKFGRFKTPYEASIMPKTQKAA